MVQYIVNIYFDRLNFHRPVSLRHEFETALAQFYAGEVQQHDFGFLCCVYLLFAFGTLSELNHHACGLDNEAKSKAGAGTSPSSNVGAQSLIPSEWPEHEDLFQRAVAVKPELRVTISSLQSLVLFHWYSRYSDSSLSHHL
jgi:hypothetical protein